MNHRMVAPEENMIMGYKRLATAIIARAVVDLQSIAGCTAQEKGTAREFLRGGPDSPFDFWCDLARLNRRRAQQALFKDKKNVHRRA